MSLDARKLRASRVLIVGCGGLGSPAAIALARSGVGGMTLIDDDRVDASNLHRQVLYGDEDVGHEKIVCAVARLESEAQARGHTLSVDAERARFTPATAHRLLASHDLVLEGADNFATKFLVADACNVAGVPCVQAGAVRWSGWALATAPRTSACLRCVFEDIPRGQPETCAEAGVVGPVVGVLGALQAALALRVLGGDLTATGELWSYDGLRGTLRAVRIRARPSCPLCAGTVRCADIRVERYAPPECAA